MQQPAEALPDHAGAEANGGPSGPPVRAFSRGATGLFVLGLFYTAYFAREVLIPIAAALLLSFILGPVVKALKRHLRIPIGVGAVLVVLGLSTSIATAFYALSSPAADWMNRLPIEMYSIERKLRPLQGPVEEVRAAAKRVEELVRGSEKEDERPAVALKDPSLVETLLGQTKALSIGLGLTIVLLLFLLASGDLLLRLSVNAAPRLRDKKLVVEVVRETEHDISHYLLTIAIINTCLGIAIGVAMWGLGLPNPALWGVMGGLLNFIPYLGALAGVCIMALVGIVVFETTLLMALPPVVYFALTTIEGQFITPALLAHRLVLNPVAVILSLIVWSWMWGIPGALVAVPLIATFKIVCDRIAWLEPVGILLGRPSLPDETEASNGSASANKRAA